MNNLFGFGHSSSSLCSSLCHFSSYWNPYQLLATSISLRVNQLALQLRLTLTHSDYFYISAVATC